MRRRETCGCKFLDTVLLRACKQHKKKAQAPPTASKYAQKHRTCAAEHPVRKIKCWGAPHLPADPSHWAMIVDAHSVGGMRRVTWRD